MHNQDSYHAHKCTSWGLSKEFDRNAYPEHDLIYSAIDYSIPQQCGGTVEVKTESKTLFAINIPTAAMLSKEYYGITHSAIKFSEHQSIYTPEVAMAQDTSNSCASISL